MEHTELGLRFHKRTIGYKDCARVQLGFRNLHLEFLERESKV
jgi:hypothetical protein